MDGLLCEFEVGLSTKHAREPARTKTVSGVKPGPVFRFNTQTPQPNTLLTLTYTLGLLASVFCGNMNISPIYIWQPTCL